MRRVALVLTLLGCGAAVQRDASAVVVSDLASAPIGPTLPRTAGPLGPTLVQARGDLLRGDDECADCHPDVAAQWSSSAHAWASISNPIYRLSLETFREAAGADTSAFCGGCHDPALLVEGAMGGELGPTDRRGQVGVGCRTCHGIAEATVEGNGSWVLGTARLTAPDVDDPASVATHRGEVGGAVLRTASLCASCHRGSIGAATGHPHALPGIDDVGPWLGSAYAGPSPVVDAAVTRRDCGGCHMPREAAPRGDVAAEDGTVVSHRFGGGHTWLAAMLGDDAQLEASQAMLRGAVTVSIAGVEDAGDAVVFDVVVRNTSVGHHFPAGTRDAQDTWIEATVRDLNGEIVARTDPGDVHRLRALAIDEDGMLVEDRNVAAIRGVAVDHTIPPRGARLSRHEAALGEGVARPLRIEARVLHRSRNAVVQRATCEDAATARGRAFASAAPRPIDPCASPPVTAVASATSDAPSDHYAHGLALLEDVQERATAAEEAFVRAGSVAGRAEVAIVQGRVDDAVALAGELGDGPAVAWLRGRAFASVWRFEEARTELETAAAGLPRNAGVWAALAHACGSEGDHGCAREAAAAGLALAPRSPALLRAQALALEGLDAPGRDAAFEAYLEHREPDTLPALRVACKTAQPLCAQESRPVHLHRLQSFR